MRIVWHLAVKEFTVIFRDKAALFWAFGFPVMMALFFGALFGGTGSGGGGIRLGVIDDDGSKTSTRFVETLKASPSLRVETPSLEEAQSKVRTGKLAAYLRLPKGFGEGGGLFTSEKVELGIDPARRAEEGYLTGILMQSAVKLMQERFTDTDQFKEQIDRGRDSIDKSTTLNPDQKKTLSEMFDSFDKWSKTPGLQLKDLGGEGGGFDFQPIRLDVKSIARENRGPKSSFDITFPQGIMWGILGSITAFAIALVLERTGGTLLRLRLAPITFGQLLAGKALACFLTCCLIVAVILLFGMLAFGVHIDQPLMLAVAVAAAGICYTGIMMLLSTLGQTERSVNGIGWGVLMPFTMIGGGAIPLFFMPEWLQNLSNISPIKWTVLGLEGAMWRGLSWGEILLPVGVQIAVGVSCFAFGVWRVNRQSL